MAISTSVVNIFFVGNWKDIWSCIETFAKTTINSNFDSIFVYNLIVKDVTPQNDLETFIQWNPFTVITHNSIIWFKGSNTVVCLWSRHQTEVMNFTLRHADHINWLPLYYKSRVYYCFYFAKVISLTLHQNDHIKGLPLYLKMHWIVPT